MTTSGEIIHLGIGNYGVLSAAHCANGFTKYDAEQNVVFSEVSERHAKWASFLPSGRDGPTMPAGTAKTVRLVLLDQSFPSRPKAARKMADNQEETATTTMTSAADAAALTLDAVERLRNEGDMDFATYLKESRRLQKKKIAAQRHVDPNRDDDDDDDDDDRSSDRDEDDDSDDEDYDEEEEDNYDDEEEGAGEKAIQRAVHQSPASLARHVPWWRYIQVPFDTRRLTLAKIDQATDDPVGGSLAHCFSHGMQEVGCHGEGTVGMLSSASGTLPTSLNQTCEALRRSLEDCDHCQGLVSFVDSDSAFGGGAVMISRYLHDEESVRGITNVAQFPFYSVFQSSNNHSNPATRTASKKHLSGRAALLAALSEDAGAVLDEFGQRRVDETALNRALSIHYLSDASDLFCPVDVHQWAQEAASDPHAGGPGGLFRRMPQLQLDDDVATSALTAAAFDTALYGCRNQPKMSSFGIGSSVAPREEDDGAAAGGVFKLWQLASHLRPESSLRLTAMNLSAPFPMQAETPAFMTAKMTRLAPRAPTVEAALKEARLLDFQNVFGSLSMRSSDWRRDPNATTTTVAPADAVLSQVVSLRGVKGLRNEGSRPQATLWDSYAGSCGGKFIATAFEERYPIAQGSFPADRLLPSSEQEDYKLGMMLDRRQPDLTTAAGASAAAKASIVRGIPLAAHLLVSFTMGRYLKKVRDELSGVLQQRGHEHRVRYGLESDEWWEIKEGIAAMTDSYDHDGRAGGEGDEEDDHDDDY